MKIHDYVIVGAGTAGCVLAERLSQNPEYRVIVLEAGRTGRHPLVSIPATFGKMLGQPRFDWCYSTEPEPHLNGRVIACPRGKLVGGSSAINGIMWVRGHREDFEDWQRFGNPGWGWGDVAPIFERIERLEGAGHVARGRHGRIHLKPNPYRHVLVDTVFAAAEQAGLPHIEDYNEPDPNGIGFVQVNVRRGRRYSVADAYLKPAMRRSNVEVITEALTTRILFKGRKAVGVEYERNGALQTVLANEVILCGGTVNSPQLLEISGIGQAARLQALGIPVVHDLAGVGENLHDHVGLPVAQRLKGVGSTNQDGQGLGLLREVIRYAFTQRGFLGGPLLQTTGFARVMEGSTRADIQVYGTPATMAVVMSKGVPTYQFEDKPGIQSSFYQCRPQSRGTLHVTSASPQTAPAIHVNYMDHPHDRAVALGGFRLCRKILAQPAFDSIRGEEISPGSAIQTDDEILGYMRASASTVYHLVGTCKMGDDALAVVDNRLRVVGTTGLRVVDASIMPQIVSGNTHATTIMIAEKGADMILEDAGRAFQSNFSVS